MTAGALPPDLPEVRPGEPIGMLAAWGTFPLEVARGLKERGYPVHCLGAVGHADPLLAEVCDSFRWQGITQMGTALRFYRQAGVRRLVMVGKFHKKNLLQARFLWKNLPDLTALFHLGKFFLGTKQSRQDDTLLLAIVRAFAKYDLHFCAATDLLPELLMQSGRLTRRGPTRHEESDIAFGWKMAKEMGRLDIGQTVAVRGRCIVAVEAVEGTDACIKRAGELCGGAPFTVVKVAKPQQDMRFDVPTIGRLTLETMASAGARVLAVESHKAIMLDRQELIGLAEKLGISLVALTDDEANRLPPVTVSGQHSQGCEAA